MVTIEKIVERPDGRIGVWTSPKHEIEFNDMGHLQAWCQSPAENDKDLAVKGLLSEMASDATDVKQIATTKSVSVDVKAAIRSAVQAREK